MSDHDQPTNRRCGSVRYLTCDKEKEQCCVNRLQKPHPGMYYPADDEPRPHDDWPCEDGQEHMVVTKSLVVNRVDVKIQTVLCPQCGLQIDYDDDGATAYGYRPLNQIFDDADLATRFSKVLREYRETLVASDLIAPGRWEELRIQLREIESEFSSEYRPVIA